MGKPCPGSLLPPMGKPCPGSLPPPMGKPKSGNLLLWENLITQGFPIGGMSLPILDRGSTSYSARSMDDPYLGLVLSGIFWPIWTSFVRYFWPED